MDNLKYIHINLNNNNLYYMKMLMYIINIQKQLINYSLIIIY